MTPDEYCQQKAAQSGSSFYYAFLFLPPERRRAITALYAFCREVDDAVDETHDANVAQAQLAWWRTQISAVYDSGELAGEPALQRPQHPVAIALVPIVRDFDLPQEHLQEIITGMEMDLTHQRYATFEGLRSYCYHVAGVVGLLSARIFGYTKPETLEYAELLGLAFQLTNIIRDVGEDARRDRIYIPIDELARFNVPAADILNARTSENFEALMKFQIGRAQKYYDEALALLPAQDRKAQRTGLVMAAIYRALLTEIETDKVLTQRTSLTPIRKLWLAWKTWVTT